MHNIFTRKQKSNFTCIFTVNTKKGLVKLNKMTSNIDKALKYEQVCCSNPQHGSKEHQTWFNMDYMLHKKLPNTNNINIPAFPLKIFITSISGCPSRQRSLACMHTTNLHQHAENNTGVCLHKQQKCRDKFAQTSIPLHIFLLKQVLKLLLFNQLT